MPDHPGKFTFGDLLRGFRERERVSREKLAAAISRHARTIALWETGSIPSDSDDIKAIQVELSLSNYETDQLLHAADFPLAYNSYIVSAQGTHVRLRETDEHILTDDATSVYGYLMLRNSEKGEVFVLNRPRMIIGRHPQHCKLKIPEIFERTSRVHAAIYLQDHAVFIKDLGSTRGTRIDNEKIEHATEIHPGQFVFLGDGLTGTAILEFSLEPAETA